MTFSFAILLLAASVSDNATASVSTTAEAPAPAEAAPEKPKKICKSTTMTGSRVGSRVCKTKEQWAQSESGMELGQKSGRGNLTPADPLGKQGI
jgi:hypothetical protein